MKITYKFFRFFCGSIEMKYICHLIQSRYSVNIDGDNVIVITQFHSGEGRSTGKRIGNTLQYSWVSLVAQLVKNPPVMWETWVLSLGWGDPLEKGKATLSGILGWRIPWTV